MITLSQINQYASTHNISEDTDIFTILSKMQLEYRVQQPIKVPSTPVDPHIEWTTEEVLALLNT